MKKRIFVLSLSLALIMLCQAVYGYSNFGVLTSLSTSGSVTCEVGSTASFSVTASYTQGSASDLRYEWHFLPNIPGHNGNRLSDGNGISGSNTSNLRVTASKDREGSYYVIVRMFDEVLNSDNMVLTVIEPVPNNPRPSETPSNNQATNYPSNNQTPNAPSNNQTQQPAQNTALPEMPKPRITTSEDSICVDWLQVKAGDGFAMNYGIRIDNEPHANVFFTPYGSNIHYFRGLTAGTNYTIELWGENSAGQKGPSYIETVKTWGTAPAQAAATPSPNSTAPQTPQPTTPTTPASTNTTAPAANTVSPAGALQIQNNAGLPFTDVPTGEWFYEPVKFVYDAGIIKGKSATTYEPFASITYAEAITLASTIHQTYTQGNVTLVPGGDKWYSNFLDYAAANGIFTPYTYEVTQMVNYEDLYNEPINRAEFVYMFYFALPEGALKVAEGYQYTPVPDVDVMFYYSPQLQIFKGAGIISGTDEAGNFNPGASINRAEVAVIISRMLKNAYNLQ